MTLLHFFDLFGVGVFAISGALTAGRKRLDLIGVLVLATVTAVGGGTLRDLLLDRHPIFWLQDATYLVVIGTAALGAVLVAHVAHPSLVMLQRALLVADALGLAVFAISGAQIAERAGMSTIAVVLLGTMTGAAGGMLRDVLANDVPLILRREELYATTAIVGIAVYLVAEQLGVPRPLPGAIGMAVVVLLRLASIWWRLALPEFRLVEVDARVTLNRAAKPGEPAEPGEHAGDDAGPTLPPRTPGG